MCIRDRVYAGWIKSDPDAGTNPFTDVYANDWFYKVVMFVYEKGLMSGISATTFAPNTNICLLYTSDLEA